MKLRPWLPTCSSTTTTIPTPKSPPSDTSQTSSTSSSSSSSSSSTLQSNLSLLTLPSVPSLQKLTLSPANTSTPPANATLVASVKPNHNSHVNSLALHNNLLYAASGNEIYVYETVTNTLFATFGSVSTGSVKSISFSDDKIFTAHQDCKIRVWRLNIEKQHKLIATLPTVEDRLRRFILPQNYVHVRRHKRKLWIEHHDAVSGLAYILLEYLYLRQIGSYFIYLEISSLCTEYWIEIEGSKSNFSFRHRKETQDLSTKIYRDRKKKKKQRKIKDTGQINQKSQRKKKIRIKSNIDEKFS